MRGPVESTFATVRHRTKVTKGPGSRAAGLAMAFKLIESARARWRAVNAPRLVALVRAGARFECGQLAERPGDQTRSAAAWFFFPGAERGVPCTPAARGWGQI